MNATPLSATIAPLVLAAICAPCLLAQTPSTVSFTLAAKDGRTTFRLGEAVEVEFRFSSSVPDEFTVWSLQPVRLVRQSEYDHFTVEPSDSVADPLADMLTQLPGGGIGGRIPMPAPLTATPTVIDFQVNEWLSIRKPGHYRISAETTRVMSTAQPPQSISLKSNALEIDVVNPEAGWAAAQLQQAVATLGIPDPPQPTVGQSFDPKVRDAHNNNEIVAARTLRFLETPEAAAALARFFEHGPQAAQSELRAGLFATPYRKEVMAAMEASVDAPDVPINYYYLATLMELAKVTRFGPTPDYTAKTKEEIRRWVEEIDRPYAEKTKGIETEYFARLADAIGRKQGEALAVSLETLVSRGGEPPTAAAAALVANFQSLPENSQQTFLSSAWFRIASPSIAPLIQSLAEGKGDLRDSALSRLRELDPDAARRIILDRLRRLDVPRQIYGNSRVLLELPEQTLPELDTILASSLEGGKPGVEVLVARYASAAVAPRLKAWVEQSPQRICSGPILPAYFFRVDPEWTAAMIARLRQDLRGGCLINLGSIEDLLMSPGLEKQAIADLSSPDVMTVRQAETLLQYAGSIAAQRPLLEAFARYRDTRVSAPDPLSGGVEQGFVLAALAANRWAPSEETFASVASLCLTEQCQRQVASAKKASTQPVSIAVQGLGDFGGVVLGDGLIWLYSDDQLRERLAYYPKGTQFSLGGNSVGSWYFEQRAAQVGRIVVEAGMRVVIEPAPVRR